MQAHCPPAGLEAFGGDHTFPCPQSSATGCFSLRGLLRQETDGSSTSSGQSGSCFPDFFAFGSLSPSKLGLQATGGQASQCHVCTYCAGLNPVQERMGFHDQVPHPQERVLRPDLRAGEMGPKSSSSENSPPATMKSSELQERSCPIISDGSRSTASSHPN